MIALTACIATGLSLSADESLYYAVDHLVAPKGCVAEVGGMDFLPDGRLVVSTRRGQVWIVENALDPDPAAAKFTLYAEGLWEGLGLNTADGAIFVVQRGELSKLLDTDGDGRCDRVETVCDSWGLSPNYHEFAFGLPRDGAGNFYVSLNLGFGSPHWWHGQSYEPWRGWVLQIAPDGTLTPYASGFRSPCGIALDARGRLLVTDNQGDWVPTSSIAHVLPGKFYGAPAGLKWTEEYRATNAEPSMTNPVAAERTPPAIWIPYGWSRSTGDLAPFPADRRRFGFGDEQLAVAEMTNGAVLRAHLEEVNGRTQGAILPLRRGVGSAIRAKFAPDGTLFLGLTNRGWGGRPPGHGIARVRPTGRAAFEIERVHLVEDGFEVRFTQPLAADARVAPSDVLLRRHHYDWWWEYGSPERDRRVLPVDSVTVADDRRSLVLRASELACGAVATVVLPELRSESGEPLLHPEFAYTVNELPGRGPCAEAIARVAPPPPARESSDQGWLRLCYADAFQMWTGEGWQLVDVDLDAADPTRLATREGVGALVSPSTWKGGGAPPSFATRLAFGDFRLRFDFLLPQGGRAMLRLLGRYDLLLAATSDERATSLDSCGALLFADGTGRAPLNPGFRTPGEWHQMDLTFRAPRFDATGKKIANARVVRALVDDVLLHEEVELPGPGAARSDELPVGPIVFSATGAGQVALNSIRIKPTEVDPPGGGWRLLADDEDLAGWRVSGGATATNEDGELVLGGAQGALLSAEEFGDVEVACRVKVSSSGQSGLWLRASAADGALAGYCVRINADAPLAEYTGSLAGFTALRVQLVGPETWAWLHASAREEAGGTRVRVTLNGVEVANVLDTRADRPKRGAIALEQHHDGSRAVFEGLRAR
ncbi:MAG: DUF1080 domain-containing protein [Planctomycetes bacterium]|nr:DUF1080 domain-containing protein [Planctomycetota bacterium]